MPEVGASRRAARARDLSAADYSHEDRGYKPDGVGADASIDPLTAVLADGSDVPSQRVLLATREQVEQRAYEIYLRRAGAPGNPEEDWYQAERELAEELRAERSRPTGAARRPAARGARKATPILAASDAEELRAEKAES